MNITESRVAGSDIEAQKRIEQKLNEGRVWRRLFSRFSFGRRTRQRGARSTGNNEIDHAMIRAADMKRLRKINRGPGFSCPNYT